jgi:hypothetical protein
MPSRQPRSPRIRDVAAKKKPTIAVAERLDHSGGWVVDYSRGDIRLRITENLIGNLDYRLCPA